MCIPSDHSALSAENEALVRRYFDMWNTGEGAVADLVLGPVYVDHAHPDVLGPARVRSLVPRFRAASPDAHISLEILGADDEIVAVHTTLKLVRDGAVTLTRGVSVFRVAEGKLVEQWTWLPRPEDGGPPSPCDVWEEAKRRIRLGDHRGLADMFAVARPSPP
jgi:predicted SnoaL-like aldol condensation-catalyzing enzyme